MEPESLPYYNRRQLAERAGISLRKLASHEAANVANLKEAREVIPGFGMVYVASHKACRKYLALLDAAAGRRKPAAVPSGEMAAAE